ncbi:MAG: tetratricopeptide repeat protein [Rudaea sp.]|nr:tetratricopeptide repeat protein [Rudaea sp.]
MRTSARFPQTPIATDICFGILFGSLLWITWCVYQPGLSGTFLFDDYANLPALGNFGPVDNWATFSRYITSGFADPTGRPLALLSFLLDAQDWPADPAPFKRTSILLHLLNGALLCWLLLQLGRAAHKPKREAALAAALGSGLWLLHPLWISTTLYVVQREAMLPATFVLLGLLGYLHGRSLLASRPPSGAAWIAGSISICTLLGILSKANGALLPLFVLTIEHVFLRALPARLPPPRQLKTCLAVIVYPVVTATFAYLLYQGYVGLVHGVPAFRPWTFTQRLLTEPRVLLDYLGLLVLPRPYSRGLFNDDFIASTSLFHPWTTLFALAVITGLLVFALRERKRFPALALAIVFYFAGQVIESTTIPLELYFEHRNYVPALLLFWPLALWLTRDGALARLKPLIAASALLLLSVETYAAASLWGEPRIQALVWAAQNPDSPRAQAYAASAERSMGQYKPAEARLRTALAAHPDEVQLAINLLGVRCQSGSIAPSDIDAAAFALRNGSNRGPLTFDWISQAIDLARNHTCDGLTATTLQQLIDATAQNRQATDSKKFQQELLDLEGQLALARADTAAAQRDFLEALKTLPDAGVALKNAAILGAAGLPEAGLQQLDYYRQLVPRETMPAIRSMEGLHQWLLYRDGYWDNEIAHLRMTLQDDVQAASNQRPSVPQNSRP